MEQRIKEVLQLLDQASKARLPLSDSLKVVEIATQLKANDLQKETNKLLNRIKTKLDKPEDLY